MANFGVGVYFLTVVWFITLLLCWVSVRTGYSVGKGAIVFSFTLTVILILVPRGEGNSAVANFYDKYFIPRYAILSFSLASLVIGAAYCFLFTCLAPVETRKIKRFGSVA